MESLEQNYFFKTLSFDSGRVSHSRSCGRPIIYTLAKDCFLFTFGTLALNAVLCAIHYLVSDPNPTPPLPKTSPVIIVYWWLAGRLVGCLVCRNERVNNHNRRTELVYYTIGSPTWHGYHRHRTLLFCGLRVQGNRETG